MPKGRPHVSAADDPLRLRAALAILCLILPSAGVAAADCTLGGAAYSSGASACIPRPQGTDVVSVLHSCEDGQWVSEGSVCPESYAYFCKVGPYAMEVGETFLLGSGPQAIRCDFPGVLSLASAGPGTNSAVPTTAEAADPMAPSRIVRRVQAFLTSEGTGGSFGIDCGGADCSGLADAATIDAVATHLTVNIENLTAEEKARFGIPAGDGTAEIGHLSPIDLFPLFVEAFDIPDFD